MLRRRALLACVLAGCAALAAGAEHEGQPAEPLRVCADPDNPPQSMEDGSGYENRIAEALARDLGRRVEYTFFPQRIGFVRNTLRAREENERRFKCDVIIGVPSGYELTLTTRPYMRSVYALVAPADGELGEIESPDDLLKLPEAERQKLRIGVFARSPGADWLLKNGLFRQAVFYQQQTGDPHLNPTRLIERDLAEGKIDLAIVWGPIAGYLAKQHEGSNAWRVVPFRLDPQIRFDYEISMGVRFGEKEWRDTLDRWIGEHQQEIDSILTSYGVPLLAMESEGSRDDDDD